MKSPKLNLILNRVPHPTLPAQCLFEIIGGPLNPNPLFLSRVLIRTLLAVSYVAKARKMVNDLHNSDPLNAYSLISLLPRAFKDSELPQKPKDSDELEPIHIYMKSMVISPIQSLFSLSSVVALAIF